MPNSASKNAISCSFRRTISGEHIGDLKSFSFEYDETVGMYRAKETPGLRAFVKSSAVECECLSEVGFDQVDRTGTRSSRPSSAGITTTGVALSRN